MDPEVIEISSGDEEPTQSTSSDVSLIDWLLRTLYFSGC
jgi:hypothetical protein